MPKKRAGILPIILSPNNIPYILLGTERSGQLNILGGQVNPNESHTSCASRELFEETIGLLNIPEDYLSKLPPSYRIGGNDTVFIVFYPVNNYLLNLPQNFNYRQNELKKIRYNDYINFNNLKIQRKKEHEELHNICWLPLYSLPIDRVSKRVKRIIKILLADQQDARYQMSIQ